MFTESTKFTYANRSSEDFGIILGRTNGLPSYKTGVSNNIIYEKINYVDNIYYYGTDKNIHEFEIELYKYTKWTVQDRYNIFEWLFQKNFEDFTFISPCGNSDYTSDIVYNCKAIGDVEAVDFGGLYGIKIKFLNSLPYATTQYTQQFFEEVNTSQIININNSGNLNEHFYNIKLSVELLNTSTGFTLKNLSDDGHTVSFSNLDLLETITIENQLGIIESSTGLNRFNKWNKNYFRLVSGTNLIQVTGNCNILVEAKFPIIV